MKSLGRFAALCIAALLLAASVCARPQPEQRRIADVRTLHAHLMRPAFARPGPVRPIERAVPAAEPAPHRRKFPVWFLRRHIATLLPASA